MFRTHVSLFLFFNFIVKKMTKEMVFIEKYEVVKKV